MKYIYSILFLLTLLSCGSNEKEPNINIESKSNSEEIFVFTPNGDLKSLPKGASALDFAFAVHTDIGLRCRGALVNGKLTPLDTVLGSGDQVEIMTSNTNKPNPRWLEFVVTARAKARIRAALKEEEKRIADEGKILLTRKLKYLKILQSLKTLQGSNLKRVLM